MPASEGIDVLKLVKETLPQTGALRVTGNNGRESVTEAMQFGASGYLVKPFNPTTLQRGWGNKRP